MSKSRNMPVNPIAASLAFCLLGSSLTAQDKSAHPKVSGIDHVRIYVTDLDKSRHFYAKLLGVRPNGGACNDKSGRCFTVGWEKDQRIELEQAPASGTKKWVAEIAFATDDIEKMRSYLVAHGVTAGKVTKYTYAQRTLEAHFEARDPEGTPISFVQRFAYATDDPGCGDPFYVRILHAGFVVKDLAVENHFYLDLLGFRPYWQGGFKDDGLDWYEIQVPDGDNWIEYMLNIPANADHAELGVQNHFSLGVRDIHAAADQLRKNGLPKFDGPEIGRDGKWSLDAYDPDGTRIEFMEFTPAQNPCCHPYTADHPKP
jgi:catechol 2,3-dioxygenase-like lactoylglutathione lyase family enzyme